MKRYIQTILSLSKTSTKAYLRDRVALFFTFIFPLIFLLVFGSLNRGNNGVSFDIAIIDQANTAFSKQFAVEAKNSDYIVRKPALSLGDAKEKMSQGELDTILLLPEGFGGINDRNRPSGRAVVFVDPGNEQTGQTFASIIEGVLGEINVQITGQEPLFEVEQRSTDERGLEAFDYVFAGLLGFSLLSLGFFGPTNGLPAMKKIGVLRRLRTTPLRTSQFVLATALEYVFIGLITTAFLFIAGVLIFKFSMQGDYLSFASLIAFGTLMMFGFGLSIGGWAKTENQAAPLTNLVAFPMMFLSGVFFPRFLMPEWLQDIAGFLPLTPLVDSIRS